MEKSFPARGELNPRHTPPSPKNDGGKLRRGLAFFLAAFGLLLIVYVSVQYGQMYAGQNRLDVAWHQQNSQPTSSVTNSNTDALSRLTIARINLDAVIVAGTSRKALKLGPGHMEDSAAPGSAGNAVIAGHRDTFFHRLDELRMGDEISVRRRGEVFRFAVVERRVVEPTDLSPLLPTTEAQLTLITCYPMHYVGPAPKRLVVVARLITPPDTPPKTPEQATSEPHLR